MDYKTREKTISVKQQMVLNPDLSISENTYRLATKQSTVDFETVVLCPFCLLSDKFEKFSIRKGLRVCPQCGNQLRTETLTEINDLEKFVKFVFNYRFNGFWEKICLDIPIKAQRFDRWKDRLYRLKLSKNFWDNYKRLKGE